MMSMKNIDVSRRGIGVVADENGRVTIRVWAPEAKTMDLVTSINTVPLQKDKEGYWTGISEHLKKNGLYRFRINGGKLYPDPASLHQPEGVHGPSQVMTPANFNWTDAGWKNHPLEDYIFYEIHTGTFTPEGNFEALEKKLDHLVELGITAIELMPVAQFSGTRNWGYDGVFPYAVQNSYGGPEGLQQLVDACHRKNLAVVLDVVYNHLGPEGNYLTAYAPYTTDKYKTPWGGAINFDDAWCGGVRHYFIENALMWFRDFHIDALRLDAVHAIKDFSPQHILQEIKIYTDELMKLTGRQHYLIVESDLNDTRFIDPIEQNGYGMDGQWIDEFHHALRTAAGGERTGYYSDFNGIAHLAKAYKDAYVYDGQYSQHRKKNFGVKTDHPGQQFVVFSQNHDQVGNRMLGERTSSLTSFEMQKLLAAAVLVSPYLPMLFMGEEWGAPHPFLYFVSHTDAELAEAVRKGRKAEFAAFHAVGEAPDPMAEHSFRQSKLQWSLIDEEPHSTMLRYYKALIALRRNHPALCTLSRKSLSVECREDEGVLVLRRWTDGQEVICLMNFSNEQQSFEMPAQDWKKIFDSAATIWLGPADAPISFSATQNERTALLQPASILVYEHSDNQTINDPLA
jgi:maltooligosyltrehalose trehalohydrolase